MTLPNCKIDEGQGVQESIVDVVGLVRAKVWTD